MMPTGASSTLPSPQLLETAAGEGKKNKFQEHMKILTPSREWLGLDCLEKYPQDGLVYPKGAQAHQHQGE